MRTRRAITYTIAAALAALLFGGCGKDDKGQEPRIEIEPIEAGEEQAVLEDTAAGEPEEEQASPETEGTSENANPADGTEGAEAKGEESLDEAAVKERFGEDCIVDQTFEVELNGCEGEVWFVPFAPSDGDSEFYAQVIRDGEVLAKLNPPSGTEDASLTSLDAVSLWDVNFDGFTDIVMIMTYGERQLAAVYYGVYYNYEESESWSFYCQEALSDNITAQASPLTVPGIRELLLGGKRNGDFENYVEAYEAVIRLSLLEVEEAPDEDLLYDLIYVDEDEIPELVSGLRGYWVSLSTYQDGTLYTLMNDWGYGAMGNAGYEYAPRKNSIRNYNADQAGAIMHTYYMRINAKHMIETPVWIESYQFIDENGNGMLDEEETYSEDAGDTYLNGEKVSDEALAAVYAEYDMGDYQYIEGKMTAEEVRKALRK